MDILKPLITQNLNLVLMVIFILSYSILIFFKDSKTKFSLFINNCVYMMSGLLFTYYVFQISYVKDYREFEYLIAFLMALSFRDLLPTFVEFTVDLVTAKLKGIDKKLKKAS